MILDGTSQILGVSQIVRMLRSRLEQEFPRVLVRGEITDTHRTAGGHLFLTLKDAGARLPAVMFQDAARSLRFRPGNGMEVLAHGEITVYEVTGKMQLRIRRLEPSGRGALQEAYDRLKKKLEEEGLFDRSRKRDLPRFPMTIGLVTSRSGAALRDLDHVLTRRWPLARRILVPVPVQGEGASIEIAEGIRRISRWGEADVVIVGRGGGSLEDLWAFNEEPVVRAIASCIAPVVTAIGHETDTTLADHAADKVAPTPSAAAEIVAPDRDEVDRRFRSLDRRMATGFDTRLRRLRENLAQLQRVHAFRRPDRFLRSHQQRVDELAQHLDRSLRSHVDRAHHSWDRARRVLDQHHPGARLAREREGVTGTGTRLQRALRTRIDSARREVEGMDRALRALDPTSVLARGYCLARDPETGRVVIRARDLDEGAPLLVQFSGDRARAGVTGVETGGPFEKGIDS